MSDSTTASDAARRERSLPRTVRLLGFASLLNDIASEMIYPLLPGFVVGTLGGSRAALGLIEGAADSLASLLKLAAGHWSDRAGQRRWFVWIGYGVTVVLRPCIAVMTAVWQVGLVRLADRFGKGVRSAPRDALIADATLPEQCGRAFGFNRAMDHAGAAIGPLLASAFLYFRPSDLRTLFALSLIPGLVLLAMLVLGLRESPATQPKNSEGPWRLTLQPFDSRFRGYLVALAIFTLGNSSDAFLLLRATQLGVTAVWLPLLWCVFHVVKSAGNWWMGHFVVRIGPRRMIVTGWLWYAAVYLLFAFASAAWHVWVLFLCYAAYFALTEPAEKTLVANLVGPERRGLAFGWFNFAVGIATLPASTIFGWLFDTYGALSAFASGAALAGVASIVLWFSTREKSRRTGDGITNDEVP